MLCKTWNELSGSPTHPRTLLLILPSAIFRRGALLSLELRVEHSASCVSGHILKAWPWGTPGHGGEPEGLVDLGGEKVED